MHYQYPYNPTPTHACLASFSLYFNHALLLPFPNLNPNYYSSGLRFLSYSINLESGYWLSADILSETWAGCWGGEHTGFLNLICIQSSF